VLSHPRAHVGSVEQNVDAGGAQVVGRADAGELQQVRCLQAAERKDDLACGAVLHDVVAAADFDSDGAVTFEEHARHQRIDGDGEVRA
jgi:hypothetical protein